MATFEKRGPYQIRAKVRKLGHRTITKTFNNKRDAEAWARGVEADMDRGAFIPSTIAQRTTIRKALERYQEEVFPRLARSGNDEKARLRRLVNDMGELSLSALEASHVAKYRDQRLKDGAAPQTVKHEIGLLGRVLKHCVMDWGIPLTRGIVTSHVRKPSLPPGRDRRLVDEEEARLLDAAKTSKSKEIEAIIVIALETAARRGEIAAMTWEHVNFVRCTWHIPHTKNGVPRTVPLSPRAVEFLQRIPQRIDGRVWALKASHSITQAFDRICKRAKIEGLNFHDLRHEATTRLFEQEFEIMEVASITGHKTLAMLQRYTHLRAENLAAKMR
ncbi:MAG TPA: site-specific integrase [Desulfobulbaceae bacterium]|nr:site-specific integrase [Desulfobulbaceae bacterium]